MLRTLLRGLVAGAAGTTAIDLATYLDMLVRGRPPSSTPRQVVEQGLEAAGATLPGNKDARAHRAEAAGALSGIVTGLGVGVVTSFGRASGVRFSTAVGPVVTGALAMAAADVPVAALGVSDPRGWSREDWRSDALPHLVYGAATHLVLRGTEELAHEQPARRPSGRLLARSLALGVATGARSSLGLVGAAYARPTGGALARTLSATALVGELAADKHPATPDRTDPQGLVPRFASAAAGAAALAARDGALADLPVACAAAGAWLGAVGGLAWRRGAQRLPDWQAALLEDGLALTLTAWACRGASS